MAPDDPMCSIITSSI
jgi:hypothetical protein